MEMKTSHHNFRFEGFFSLSLSLSPPIDENESSMFAMRWIPMRFIEQRAPGLG